MLKDKEWWQGQVLSPDFSLSSPAHLPVSHRVSHPGWSSNIPEWPMIWKTRPPPLRVFLVTWLLVSDLILAFFYFYPNRKGKIESIEIKVEQRMGNKKVFNRGIDIADMKWFLLAKDSSDISQKY